MLQQERAAQQEVAVWFVNGEPARLVVDGRRWRVIPSSVVSHNGEPSYRPPMLTQPPQHAEFGYTFAAVSADGVEQAPFSIGAVGESWCLR